MAGTNPTYAAGIIYRWATGDSTRIADVRGWRDSAINGAFGAKGGANSIQSASKNGVAYTMLVSMSESERLIVLDLAISYLENGVNPSTRTVATF